MTRRYREVYLPHPHDLDGVLIGFGGRAAFEDEVRRRPGLPARLITPVITRFSRGHVVQVGSDPANNTVMLAPANTDDTALVRVLGRLNSHYKPKVPLVELGHALDALEADYPQGTITRALADTVHAVLRLWVHQRRAGDTTMPLQLLDQLIAERLEPWAKRQALLREFRELDDMPPSLILANLPHDQARDRVLDRRNACGYCGRCCDCRRQ